MAGDTQTCQRLVRALSRTLGADTRQALLQTLVEQLQEPVNAAVYLRETNLRSVLAQVLNQTVVDAPQQIETLELAVKVIRRLVQNMQREDVLDYLEESKALVRALKAFRKTETAAAASLDGDVAAEMRPRLQQLRGQAMDAITKMEQIAGRATATQPEHAEDMPLKKLRTENQEELEPSSTSARNRPEQELLEPVLNTNESTNTASQQAVEHSGGSVSANAPPATRLAAPAGLRTSRADEESVLDRLCKRARHPRAPTKSPPIAVAASGLEARAQAPATERLPPDSSTKATPVSGSGPVDEREPALSTADTSSSQPGEETVADALPLVCASSSTASQGAAEASVRHRALPTASDETPDPSNEQPPVRSLRSALKAPRLESVAPSDKGSRQVTKRVRFAPDPALAQVHVFEWIPNERTHAPVNIAGLVSDEDGSAIDSAEDVTGSDADRSSLAAGGIFSEVVEEGRLMHHMRQRRRKALEDMHEDASFYSPPRVLDAPTPPSVEREQIAPILSGDLPSTEREQIASSLSSEQQASRAALVSRQPSTEEVWLNAQPPPISPEEPSLTAQYEEEKQLSMRSWRLIPERRVLHPPLGTASVPVPSTTAAYPPEQRPSSGDYLPSASDRSLSGMLEQFDNNAAGSHASLRRPNDRAQSSSAPLAGTDAAILQHFLSLSDEEERLRLLNDTRVLQVVQRYAEEKQREAALEGSASRAGPQPTTLPMYSPFTPSMPMMNMPSSIYPLMGGNLLPPSGYQVFMPAGLPHPETSRGTPNGMPVCKYYLQGRCRYRDKCRFWHPSTG
jgi:hypothetical protein